MEKKINDFFLKYNGIGIDFDGKYGFQCMDVYQQYNKEVTGSAIILSDAIDVINKYDKNTYDFIPNSPTNYPSLGDVILWTSGIGQYGHIAICYYADSNHFISMEQNFPIGSLCHFQSHNYINVAGWLHPKANTANPTPTPLQEATDQTKFDFGDPYGINEMQAVRSMLLAKDQEITNLKNNPITVTTTVTKYITPDVPTYLKSLSFWERVKLVFS